MFPQNIVLFGSFNVVFSSSFLFERGTKAVGSNMSRRVGAFPLAIYEATNHQPLAQGHPGPQTPPRLREGLVFKEAYAGYTVCAPSRTTFFTGRQTRPPI